MERLTIKRRLPEKGLFMEVSKNEVRQIGDVSPDDVYRRLQAYEDTGLTPEEVEVLKADNDRLHRLIDELESGLRKENDNA